MARTPRVPEGASRPLRAVWRQCSIPVLVRPQSHPPLFVRLPYSATNRSWLQACGRINPKLVQNAKSGRSHWEVPMAWFSPLIRRCIEKYGRVYVIQPVDRSEVCASSCWNAKREICECSCLGTNHGGGRPAGSWKEISEAFAVQWSRGELACQLLIRADGH